MEERRHGGTALPRVRGRGIRSAFPNLNRRRTRQPLLRPEDTCIELGLDSHISNKTIDIDSTIAFFSGHFTSFKQAEDQPWSLPYFATSEHFVCSPFRLKPHPL